MRSIEQNCGDSVRWNCIQSGGNFTESANSKNQRILNLAQQQLVDASNAK
jgi:hypothetical protein